MKTSHAHLFEEPFNDELLSLLLDEAERALLGVEARADEQGRRILHGDVPDRDQDPPAGVSELRLALAELADAFPSVHADLETIGERMRNVGINAGLAELEGQPHVLDLVRLSLEILFRIYPAAELYEADQRLLFGTGAEESQSPVETYDSYARLLQSLKTRLS